VLLRHHLHVGRGWLEDRWVGKMDKMDKNVVREVKSRMGARGFDLM
jgi:hypothetical protein